MHVGLCVCLGGGYDAGVLRSAQALSLFQLIWLLGLLFACLLLCLFFYSFLCVLPLYVQLVNFLEFPLAEGADWGCVVRLLFRLLWILSV